ncbi:hypothetical protein CDD83_3211 [Cordyceps sp. RAO-2017]|nr:hypothetical protein CDD83_3211 [Cordyceps sp. RAO-2017]
MSCQPWEPLFDDLDDPDDLDDASFSLASTAPDIETIFTRSDGGHETDDYDLLSPPWDDDDPGPAPSYGESTSVSPSVHEDEMAHGRRYHGYRRGRYPLPNDSREQRRDEMNHAMMLEITRGHLFFADIGDHPQKIIDIGTGIGSWVIDVADLYPSASVTGTDLSAIQPKWVPVNVRMFVDDCEGPDWLHGSGYDLVFFRGMAGVLRDLDGVLERIFPRIKIGGWVEFHEVIPQIMCDDGSMSDDDPLRLFYDAVTEGLRRLGCDPLRTARLEETLDHAKFANVRCITKKVPISAWPRDGHLKAVGILMQTVMLESLDALAAKPLDALGMSPEDRRVLMEKAEKSLEDTTIHRYVNCCFCFGQRRREQDVFSVPPSYYH